MARKTQTDRRLFWNRWRLAAWGTAAALILLPLLAMQFTQEVNWGTEDFAFATVMVVGVGVTYELAVRMTGNRAYRAGAAVALVAAFVLVWANAAVGIIGSENNRVNWLFDAVPVVGIVGALMARFQPVGMARAMVGTALAQMLVAVIALAVGFDFTGPVTVFFTGMWLISAWLFRRAARA
jgi:hypothetical protein